MGEARLAANHLARREMGGQALPGQRKRDTDHGCRSPRRRGAHPVKRLIAVLFALLPIAACAVDLQLPGVHVEIADQAGKNQDLALALKIVVGLTLLSLAPGMLIVATAFTRIILVLSMLRHAIGMQQTPPNTVLLSLAMFLTAFSMMPVIETINETAYAPYVAGQITTEKALDL